MFQINDTIVCLKDTSFVGGSTHTVGQEITLPEGEYKVTIILERISD
jgi:hypothetical protein